MMETFIQMDKDLFLFLNGIHNPLADQIMWYISRTMTWIPLYLLLLWVLFKKLNLKRFLYALALIALMIVISDSGSVHLFKNVFQRLRPCHDPSLEGMVHIVKNKCGGQYGFISSHAANTFAVATFFFMILRSRIAIFLLVVWAAIVSYSRIYLGVHFPGDVLGGLIWGAIAGVSVFLFDKFTFRWLVTVPG
jgi:undecaprenyl-diphosphatase